MKNNYKKAWLIFLFMAINSMSFAKPTYAKPISQISTANLDEVTIYLQGAELFSSANISFPAGESELILTNISPHINQKTLLLNTNEDILIKSISVKRDRLTNSEENLASDLKAINREIETLIDQRIEWQTMIKTIDMQLAVLNQNTQLNEIKSTSNIRKIQELWRFIDTEASKAIMKKSRLQRDNIDIEKRITALKKELFEKTVPNRKMETFIVVKVFTNAPTQGKINLSYAIHEANWSPSYDIRVNSLNAPIYLTYKANIAQASEVDWNDVRITLSTENLPNNTTVPILTTNYLSIDENKTYYSDINHLAVSAAKEMVNELESLSLPPRNNSHIDQFIINNTTGISSLFTADLSHSIPSDAQQHEIAIKEEKLEGQYQYIVIPSINTRAFLHANITNWQKLKLLSGPISIFFKGGFIGEKYLNPENSKEKILPISLGFDKNIVINYEKISIEKQGSNFLGNNTIKEYEYKIDVNNLHNESISLKIIDQIPVSRDSSIKITNIQLTDEAKLNHENGEVTWHLLLNAHEKKSLPFSYHVKFPQGKEIHGLTY